MQMDSLVPIPQRYDNFVAREGGRSVKDRALLMDDITDSTDCMTLRLGSYIIGKGLVLHNCDYICT